MKKTFLLIPILVTAAHASLIHWDSSAANTTNNTNLATINIDPHPAWAPAIAGSHWVSILPTGNPKDKGYVVVKNGFTVDFSQSFFLDGSATNANLSVMADDTTSVSLNGGLVYGAANPKGGYPTCSSAPIGCLVSTRKDFTFADLQPYLHSGQNILTFGVVQKHGASFGLDYAGSVASTAPEPSSLLLIGAGLLAVAGVRRRGQLLN